MPNSLMALCRILLVVTVLQITGAVDFSYVPELVHVPHVHDKDYVVWSKIEAMCKTTYNWTHDEDCSPSCSSNKTSTSLSKCTRCEVMPNSSHLLYERDMRIYKRACATTECSNTCPGTNCIPPGERITVGVRCWMNWHSQTGYERQYTSTTFDIVSVLESAYSSCPALTVEGGHLSANDTTHCSTVSVSCDQDRTLSGESSMICCNGKWSTEIPVCLKECHNNHFGRNCSSPCDCVVNNTITPNQSCHSYTGACQCTPSWTGDRCQSRCEDGQCGIHEANRVERFTDDSESLVLPLSLGFGVFGFILVVAIVTLVWWRKTKKKQSETKQKPRQVSVIDILQVGRQSLPPRQEPDDDPNYCALNFQNPMTRKSEGIQNGSQRQIPALSINQGKMEFV